MLTNELRHKRYAKDTTLITQQVIDEFLLVPAGEQHMTLGSLYLLNEVAGTIWNLIDGERCVGDIARQLAEVFEVAPEQAEHDVAAFLTHLERMGVVRAV